MSEQFNPTGSWVAIVTPMDADDHVDRKALAALVDRHCESGTAGIVAAGTTGESAALGDDDFSALVETCLQAADGRIPVMVGAGSPATAKAVHYARRAEQLGADALLCVTPYYLKTSQAGLRAHYQAIVDAVDLPMVLYNVPGRTAMDLLPETTARLAEIPQVVGIKEAVGDESRVLKLVQQCPEGFRILSGDDATCLRTMRLGGDGVVSVTANVVPGAMARLCRLAADGNWDEAGKLDEVLAPLHEMTMREPNPSPIKTLLHRQGRIGPRIRLPLLPASDALVDEMMNWVHEHFSSDLI